MCHPFINKIITIPIPEPHKSVSYSDERLTWLVSGISPPSKPVASFEYTSDPSTHLTFARHCTEPKRNAVPASKILQPTDKQHQSNTQANVAFNPPASQYPSVKLGNTTYFTRVFCKWTMTLIVARDGGSTIQCRECQTQKTWDQFLVWPPTCCVMLGKSSSLFCFSSYPAHVFTTILRLKLFKAETLS